jgi:hypothetical protein
MAATLVRALLKCKTREEDGRQLFRGPFFCSHTELITHNSLLAVDYQLIEADILPYEHHISAVEEEGPLYLEEQQMCGADLADV